ncbi:MAG: hypothetical protein WCL10_19560 [Novosphingobium sp.]|uniref:hypothetical protein n=1 Tax=Novosphingobium sp. TaxID=1874826 RepID=UPI0030199202
MDEHLAVEESLKANSRPAVSLAERSVEILREVLPLNTKALQDAPVFPSASGGKLSVMAMSMLLRRMDRDAITVHGFRSTFRDWAGESTSFPREVVEHATPRRTNWPTRPRRRINAAPCFPSA